MKTMRACTAWATGRHGRARQRYCNRHPRTARQETPRHIARPAARLGHLGAPLPGRDFAALENRYRCKPIVGSNPTLSARLFRRHLKG